MTRPPLGLIIDVGGKWCEAVIKASVSEFELEKLMVERKISSSSLITPGCIVTDRLTKSWS